jgi:hypothetical protein
LHLRVVAVLFTVTLLWGCDRGGGDSFPHQRIVLDNAQAAVYFHAAFREAVFAWSLVDSKDYVAGVYTTADGLRTCTYGENTVTVDFSGYTFGSLELNGSMEVEFDTCSFRKDREIADVYLTGFSINGQDVVGEATIQFSAVENSVTDHYTYSLLEGSTIYEAGSEMPALITGSISNGSYERIEGNETVLEMDDDVWVFSGSMTGTLSNQMRYTYNVVPSYVVNGVTEDGRVFFVPNCNTAASGMVQISIPGGPEIGFGYDCSQVVFISLTKVK